MARRPAPCKPIENAAQSVLHIKSVPVNSVRADEFRRAVGGPAVPDCTGPRVTKCALLRRSRADLSGEKAIDLSCAWQLRLSLEFGSMDGRSHPFFRSANLSTLPAPLLLIPPRASAVPTSV